MHNLSKRLIQKEYNIISGFGLGVGSFIINGILDAVYSKGNYIDDRLIMRPFPQKSSGGKILKDLWTDYRKEMISLAGISIFIFGNKKDSNGDIIDANGMIEEFNIAKEQNTFIIPIATTGYSSKAIMDEIKNDLDKYWYLRDSINILENEKNSER